MKFPVLCVDNFYKNPEKIRNFALSLDYKKDLSINPGLRTEHLYNIDIHFFNKFCEKLFSLFYNYDVERCDWKVETKFQKTFRKSNDPNSILNMGWNHLDNNVVFAGVIYLNQNPYPNSGTTISKLNGDRKIFDYAPRDEFYSSDNYSKLKDYELNLLNHDKNFEDSIIIKNKFNRMICYDSNYWHKESNFFSDFNDPRLTQVFFVHDLKVSSYPIERSNLYNL